MDTYLQNPRRAHVLKNRHPQRVPTRTGAIAPAAPERGPRIASVNHRYPGYRATADPDGETADAIGLAEQREDLISWGDRLWIGVLTTISKA